MGEMKQPRMDPDGPECLNPRICTGAELGDGAAARLCKLHLRFQIRVCSCSFEVQYLLKFAPHTRELRLGDGQRRRKADDVSVLAFRQEDVAAMQHGLDDA